MTLLAALCIALGALSAPQPPSLPPCPTEDSTGCYWDADTMGNGLGHDVVSLHE